jgi:hypothetical protein
MGFLGEAWDVVKEVGLLGCEVAEVAGEDTPLIGTAVNGVEAAYHYGKSSDAENRGDMDEADYEHDKAGYNLLKAIPGVGTVLGVTELMNGTVSAVRGNGFHNGMEDVGDSVMDWGAALGIGALGASNPIPLTGAPPKRSDRDDDGDGGNNYHDTWGSHGALRQSIEEKERFDEAAQRAAERKRAQRRGA